MRHCGKIGLMLMLLGAVAGAAAPPSSGGSSIYSPYASPRGGAVQAPAASEQVRAELLADVTALEPGRPFRLGVRFTLQPGWHVYWRTAGDVGRATRIKWSLPPGFSAGPLQWPTPHRFEDSGLVSYGYEGEVLLFMTVTPPARLDRISYPISARPDWIACKEACIPGEAKLELTLPVGVAAPSPSTPVFERAVAQVPVPLSRPATDRFRIEFSPPPAPVEPGRERRLEVTVELLSPWRLDGAAKTGPPALFPVVAGAVETSHPQLLAGGTPERVRFTWPVTFTADSATTAPQLEAVLRLPLLNATTNQHQLAQVAVAVPSSPTAASAPGGLAFLKIPVQHQSLWLLLVYAFIGGFILNFFPCVLPVLSLKVLAFVRQAGEDRRRTFRLGLAYTFGVLVSFGVLAGAIIALKAAGLQVGQGFQFQEPRFVIIMAGVVFALSLSLLGVYTIELPGAAVNRMDRFTRREGYPGAFLGGVLATALATPCTAPFLGPALGFAFTQRPSLILLFLLITGLGLATPYLLLSLNPAWLRFLPRPGRWMLVFEQLMGFVMLGFTLWLLSVLGSLTGASAVVWTLTFLLTVAVGCWLLGLAGQSGWSRPKWALAAAAALMLALGGFMAFPERYLRQHKTSPGVEQTRASRPGAGVIAWEPFSVARVEQLVREGRTVFVDFTAEWCWTCKINERNTLETEKARQLFERYQVTPLKADWTARDETIGRVLSQFGSSGVPLYVVFPAGRAEQPRILPTLISVEDIERALAPPPPGA